MFVLAALTLNLYNSVVLAPPQARLPFETLQEASQTGVAFARTLEYYGELPGVQVAVPPSLLTRVNLGVDNLLKPKLRPPRVRNWIGNRDAPKFEHEFLRLGWNADGRSLAASDLDPEMCLLVQLKEDEIDTSSDSVASEMLLTWLRKNLRMPDLRKPYRVVFIQRPSMPGGRHLLTGIVTTIGDNGQFDETTTDKDFWAQDFGFWTDGKYLSLNIGVWFSCRPPVNPGQGPGGVEVFTKSRFDP